MGLIRRALREMMLLTAAVVGVVLSAFVLVMALVNLRVYRCPPGSMEPCQTPVFVCVPARNEEANIDACVRTLLAQSHTDLRVLVYDDGSTDATPDILVRLVSEDDRVIAVPTAPLPDGWNGKQHGCWRMARHAIDELGASPNAWVVFTDADVRFEPDAVACALAAARELGAPFVSTFPRQITGTPAEAAVVPMIFFILFGYLPMPMMRRGANPSTCAACGQFIMVRADAYDRFGGHAECCASMHEGVKLPRIARRAGVKTDLFDGSRLCSVRMYRGLAETWRGFAKNAYEGLGSPIVLVVFTLLHLIGQLGPWVIVLSWWWTDRSPAVLGFVLAAIVCQLTMRTVLARRLGHTVWSAVLHPVGVIAMTAIQWHSFVLQRTGRRSWRGRTTS